MRWITPALIGLFAGSVGGFFGISGAFIILSLISFLKLVPDQRTAAGTTLFILLPPISILAVYQYYKDKQIDFRLGFAVMFFYILGGWIGAKGAHVLSNKEIKLLLAIMFLILAIINFDNFLKTKD